MGMKVAWQVKAELCKPAEAAEVAPCPLVELQRSCCKMLMYRPSPTAPSSLEIWDAQGARHLQRLSEKITPGMFQECAPSMRDATARALRC